MKPPVGSKVRVKVGHLLCSKWRPHQGQEGVVTAVWDGNRYSISVRFPGRDFGTLTYHDDELEPAKEKS